MKLKSYKSSFTRQLPRQSMLLGYFVLVPSYLYCMSIIVTALIKFCVLTFNIQVTSSFVSAWLNLLFDGFLAIVALIIFWKFFKVQIDDFRRNKAHYLIYSVTAGIAIMYCASLIGSLILSFFSSQDASANQSAIESLTNAYPVAMFVSAVFLAPILEELLFRGLFFTSFYKINPVFAHLMSAFLFGFVHVMDSVLAGNIVELIQIIPYFCMGLSLSFLYEKQNNLCVPIIVHMLNNFISMMVIFFAGSLL